MVVALLVLSSCTAPAATPATPSPVSTAPAPTATVPMPSTISTAPPATAAAEACKTVTLDDDGKTCQYTVGDEFLLKLGEGFDWSIEIDNQQVVSRVPNIAVVRGAQGIYRTHQAGEATLTAVGDPPCRKETPACGAPSRLFSFHIVVR
jgi:hypothetical protein